MRPRWHMPWHMSTFRRQPQQVPAVAVLEQVDRDCGPLANEADARARHAPLLGLLRAIAVEGDADQSRPGERPDEAAALPLREQVARVDQQTGRRDRGNPERF